MQLKPIVAHFSLFFSNSAERHFLGLYAGKANSFFTLPAGYLAAGESIVTTCVTKSDMLMGRCEVLPDLPFFALLLKCAVPRE